MKLPKMKIYVEQKNGKWIWRIYSTLKHLNDGSCACLAHGSAVNENIAYDRAEKKMKELKQYGELAHFCRF